jgi:hypothetical protein
MGQLLHETRSVTLMAQVNAGSPQTVHTPATEYVITAAAEQVHVILHES